MTTENTDLSFINFDADQVEPAMGFEAIPNGKYRVCITKSDVRAAKSGKGYFLALMHQVVDDGPYKGRTIWKNINVQHENSTAQNIGQGELSALCRAVGIAKVKDSTQLHDKPVMVQVGTEPDQNGKPRNTIEKYIWKKETVVAGEVKPSEDRPAWMP